MKQHGPEVSLYDQLFNKEYVGLVVITPIANLDGTHDLICQDSNR